ncbi:hypothetical protein Leryth_026401 [Lithospermum erythrorhizon]|nr:hypothetical protein Leryth_026401 [Lithospermum erythrorhizon]
MLFCSFAFFSSKESNALTINWEFVFVLCSLLFAILLQKKITLHLFSLLFIPSLVPDLSGLKFGPAIKLVSSNEPKQPFTHLKWKTYHPTHQ